MLNISFAGSLGRDAEYKETQSGKGFCSFAVAVNTGFGERKQTYWIDVTRWGEGANGLSRHLTKGTKVAVCGELATREHNGKTYLQCRADNVTLMGSAGDRPKHDNVPDPNNREIAKQFTRDEMDDEIPF